MFMSRPSKAACKLISLMGCFFASENVRWRKRIGAEKVKVSMSSEPAAYTCERLDRGGHDTSV